MDILAPFIPDRQPPIAIEPCQGALDHPAIPAQPLAGVAAFAGDPVGDAALPQGLMTAGNVVRLVGMELGRPEAWPSWLPARTDDRRDRLDQRLEEALAETSAGEIRTRQWPVLVTARGFTYGTAGKTQEAKAVLREMEERRAGKGPQLRDSRPRWRAC